MEEFRYALQRLRFVLIQVFDHKCELVDVMEVNAIYYN